MNEQENEYAGFWIRAGATIIDTILIMAITFPLLISIYGWAYFSAESGFIAGPADFLISWVLPAMAVILFWIYTQATPGKMAIAAKIVDASSGKSPTAAQPLGLGFFWVAFDFFDKRKQGWHDKLANTVVIRSARRGTEPVRFDHA